MMMGNVQAFRIYRVLRSHFLKKKSWKNAYFSIFRIYRALPYSSPGRGKHCSPSCHSVRQNNPKNPREICVWRLETRRVPVEAAPAGTGASAKPHAQYSN